MRNLLVLSLAMVLGWGAGLGPANAQGGPPTAMLTLGRCAPGSIPSGVARFQNVGNNDLNEGAPNRIAITLCAFSPDVAIELTAGPCRTRVMNKVRFQNVANNDFNEGAPNFIVLSLCIRGPVRQFFALTRGACRAGLHPIGVVRFKNVGNTDFNEGAPNFVTIRLCVEDR